LFIEILDLLRCINPHEDTWLVASLKAVSNRFVLDATLGCPVCHAEYPIRKGVADFRVGGEIPHQPSDNSPSLENRAELATRVGAFLNATEPGATLILGGSWAEAAQELSVMTETRVVAVNPGRRVEESETVGLLKVSRQIPLAPASVLGAAFDASFSTETILSAMKVVRPGGRIVAPVVIDVPSELALLARDDTYWVGEKPAEMVPLRRSGISE
jgi:hypothetical protein